LLKAQGRVEEAASLYKRAIAVGEKALGPEHPNLASILNNFGLLLSSQGRIREAASLHERAIAIIEKSGGRDHPNLASILKNLARLFQDEVHVLPIKRGLTRQPQGRLQEAVPLYERAIAVVEKSFGPEHPDLAATLNDLAAAHTFQRKVQEAMPLYERSIAISEKCFGPENSDLASTLNNFAALLCAQGKDQEALPIAQRATAIFMRTFGPEHPHTQSTAEFVQMLQDGSMARLRAAKKSKRSTQIAMDVDDTGDHAESNEGNANLGDNTQRD